MSQFPSASRPKMQNYGIEAGADGLMSWSWVEDQLQKARNYWIASTRPDGTPHAAPLWGIWLDGVLIFGSDARSRKAQNIAHQPRVALHLESGDEVVILEGIVSITEDDALLQRFGKLYAQKYGLDPVAEPMPGSAFYVFRPETALTWLEHDFPRTATRWSFAPAQP